MNFSASPLLNNSSTNNTDYQTGATLFGVLMQNSINVQSKMCLYNVVISCVFECNILNLMLEPKIMFYNSNNHMLFTIRLDVLSI